MSFEVINPQATGVSPTRSAKVLDVASSRTIHTGMTQEAHLLATGSDTGDVYGLFHYEARPAEATKNLHLHKEMTEAFFVLEGNPTLFNGTKWERVGPGRLLQVPPQAVHGFYNDTDHVARMLMLFVPGVPREKFFSGLNEIFASGRKLSQQEWDEFYAEHDQFMVREQL